MVSIANFLIDFDLHLRVNHQDPIRHLADGDQHTTNTYPSYAMIEVVKEIETLSILALEDKICGYA